MNFQVLGNMKHCILATDLALFFPNKVFSLKDFSSSTYSNYSGTSEQPREREHFQLGRPPAQVQPSYQCIQVHHHQVPQHRYILDISVPGMPSGSRAQAHLKPVFYIWQSSSIIQEKNSYIHKQDYLPHLIGAIFKNTLHLCFDIEALHCSQTVGPSCQHEWCRFVHCYEALGGFQPDPNSLFNKNYFSIQRVSLRIKHQIFEGTSFLTFRCSTGRPR